MKRLWILNHHSGLEGDRHYELAKEMAAVNMDKDAKEWESLWGEEEEKEYEDPFEASQNAETNVEMPEGMEVQTAADAGVQVSGQE